MKKNNIISFLVLIVLSVLVVSNLDLYKGKKDSFLPLKKTKISTVLINNNASIITLNYVHGNWELAKQKAATKVVESFLDNFYGEAAIDLVSMNPSKNEQYDVTPSKNQWINFNERAKLIIGKRAGYTGMYIRKSDDKNIYKINKRQNELLLAKNQLIDRNPYQMKIDNLDKVAYFHPSGNFVIQKKKENWQFKTNKTVSSNLLLPQVRSLLVFQGLNQDTATENAKIEETSPEFRLKFTLADPKKTSEVKLYSYKNQYYLKDDTGKYWYTLAKNRIDKTIKALLEFQLIKPEIKAEKKSEEEAVTVEVKAGS
jgi:hypothetical protein